MNIEKKAANSSVGDVNKAFDTSGTAPAKTNPGQHNGVSATHPTTTSWHPLPLEKRAL
jgi:hypothetical protein